ncbi:DUF3137 domain-containing protein [Holdemanella sp. L34]|uniref:DUF3137 domain-containing protein n=1 Tax=Holdemanella hominis TaxID=2764327 RepID=A0ABR7KKJ1_9FIRM|nr:DUF3137 domain-containing protein [Holdemanella hominis]
MCKLDQKFNTWLTIYPCNALDKQSIKTGYETFDKKFNLTCGDEKLVLEILDSNRLKQIIALSNHKFSINLNEDGRLYIDAHSFKNMNDLKWFVDMIDVFSGYSMNYKELYLETKEMLEEFDFIDRRLLH